MSVISVSATADGLKSQSLERIDNDYGYYDDQCSSQTIGTSNNVYNIKIKMMNYLSDVDSTFAIFSSYELIKKVFIRYNTTLPSSAPVERLFSSAGLIETHRRNSLTDSIFEKLLLLKMNKL